jgi:hypothetical protein
MSANSIHAISIRAISAVNEALGRESGQCCALVAVMWVDLFLTCRLKNEFGKGNNTARESLFAIEGPFSSLSAKINAAFCAGWISAHLHHDLHALRKIRNYCAHDLSFPGLNDKMSSKRLATFKTPHRQFHDWGALRAASTANGSVIIYSGDRPKEATGDLDFTVPGDLAFRLAIPVLLAVLVSQLQIPFVVDDKGHIANSRLPDHMRDAERDNPANESQPLCSE